MTYFYAMCGNTLALLQPFALDYIAFCAVRTQPNLHQYITGASIHHQCKRFYAIFYTMIQRCWIASRFTLQRSVIVKGVSLFDVLYQLRNNYTVLLFAHTKIDANNSTV